MKAKLGREDELVALKRLDDQSRRLERAARGRSVEALIAEERRVIRLWRPERLRMGAAPGGARGPQAVIRPDQSAYPVVCSEDGLTTDL
jgi:hypothetical protein